MAPSLKSRRKKKIPPVAESENQEVPGLCPEEETTMGSPAEKEPSNAQGELEQADSPGTKPETISKTEQKSPNEDSGGEQTPSSEKEEEQMFLDNLYKFMKERHTPIERVPHLGFKQINLFKIYKVVEKLGAYELVTGRRLWKNVYDMLGGNPGSTSAATCTRRHYERLVLPYVRHLKGEGDKPLPPVKPRKQYKVSKEPKGDKGKGPGDKRTQKKEKLRDQAVPEKMSAEVVAVPKPPNDLEQCQPQEPAESQTGPEAPEIQALDGSSGNCRAHSCSEGYKRLFSSFYFKGNHGIMSPLAKKKLLAQVTKDESFYSHDKALSHCPECKKARAWESPISNAEASPKSLSTGHQREARKSPALEVDDSSVPNGSSQASKSSEGVLKVAPSLKESLGTPKAEDKGCGDQRSAAPPVFNGYFHPPRNDVVKPISCHPLRGSVEYYGGFKSFPGTLSSYQAPGKDRPLGSMAQKRQESPEDQPEDLRRKPSQPLPSWRGDGQQRSPFQMGGSSGKREPSPFAPVKASWVPPVVNLAKVSPQVPKGGDQSVSPGQAGGLAHKKRPSEEDFFLHGKKLKAVSPFMKEVESSRKRMEQGSSPNGQQGALKPKAVVPTSVFPVAPVPPVQDMYKGTMLRLPMNFSNAGDHLKGQSPALIPSLSISPFIIPAFPTPLLTASVQPSDICQPLGTSLIPYPSYDGGIRHRVYPISTWHSQPAYASPHVPAFHQNTKL